MTRVRQRLDVIVLALLAYVPALLAAPGRLPADTKLYLFLDPGRLIGDAARTWDPAQFAGWFPHQTALYLWPTGPWFWLCDTLGVPDWVAHRVWIGTILVAAGLGARRLGRVLGLGAAGALCAALVYQLSPYVLPYVSRTSVMLLPWAGMCWIVVWTIRAAHSGRWRPAVWASLVAATVTGVNATATLMIVPAPVIWLVVTGAERRLPWRRVIGTMLRIGGLSVGLSLWWIVKIVQQGRYGAKVLTYSETLDAVSATSTSTEVLRGLGYWLFYVRDPYIATTTSSHPYLASPFVVLGGFALALVGLAGLAATRWTARRYAAVLLGVGVILSVGAHGFENPTLLQRALYADPRSTLGLALRSSSRAVPLVTLALALGCGALVTALRVRRPRLGRVAPLAIVVLVLANMPGLFGDALVDPALERDASPPTAWTDAVAALGDDGGRVLQLPGQESSAFRWGYTVDPPLPGLTRRSILTRDWLPLGSAAAMDLLYALDDRVQTSQFETTSLAPVAALLGVDTVWLSGDIAHDRFVTARPEPLIAEFEAGIAGLGDPTPYGTPIANTASLPRIDERSLSDPHIGAPVAPVSLAAINDPAPVDRAKTAVVALAGNGDGIIDAAAAGLVDGTAALRYTADGADIETADGLVITDTNRRRAHHWRSSRDVTGFTEDGSDEPLLRDDPADQRLPVFTDDSREDQTLATQEGPVTVRASSYGNRFGYRPEVRAWRAIDGDPTSAWIVADRADPVGEAIELSADAPLTGLRVVQPLGATNRWITAVDVSVDGGASRRIELGASSRSVDGQDIELPTPGTTVRLTIVAVDSSPRDTDSGLDGVGFAELDADRGPTTEVVHTPQVDTWPDDRPLAVVLTRLRADDTERRRADPEPTIVRSVTLPRPMAADVSIDARFDARADDDTIARLLQVPVTASSHLVGAPRAAGWAAFDGDPDTAWQTPFGGATGAWVRHDQPLAGDLTVRTLVDDRHSSIRSLRVEVGDDSRSVDVSDDGTARLQWDALDGTAPITITIEQIEPRTTVDRLTFDIVQLPAAITEIAAGSTPPVAPAASIDTGCRDDLLTIADEPVAIRLVADVDDLLDGRTADTTICSSGARPIASGEHNVVSSSVDGWEIDRVVLVDGTLPTGGMVDVEQIDRSATTRSLRVQPCPDGCWLVHGEGANDGWSATVGGEDLGTPSVIDGGMSGWWLAPSSSERTVDLRWSPQRAMDLAIWISLLVVALCAVLVARDRGRLPGDRADIPAWGRAGATTRRRAVRWVVLGSALAFVVAGAAVALTVLVLSSLSLLLVRSDRVLLGIGLLGVGANASVVVWRVARGTAPADFGFAAAVDDLHTPMLAALACVVLALAAAPGIGHRRESR